MHACGSCCVAMIATLSQCLSFVHYFVKLITLMNWGLNGYPAGDSYELYFLQDRFHEQWH